MQCAEPRRRKVVRHKIPTIEIHRMERSASQDKVFNSVIARGQNLRREGVKLGTFASAARHMAQRKRKINAPLQSGTRACAAMSAPPYRMFA